MYCGSATSMFFGFQRLSSKLLGSYTGLIPSCIVSSSKIVSLFPSFLFKTGEVLKNHCVFNDLSKSSMKSLKGASSSVNVASFVNVAPPFIFLTVFLCFLLLLEIHFFDLQILDFFDLTFFCFFFGLFFLGPTCLILDWL